MTLRLRHPEPPAPATSNAAVALSRGIDTLSRGFAHAFATCRSWSRCGRGRSAPLALVSGDGDGLVSILVPIPMPLQHAGAGATAAGTVRPSGAGEG